jgi:hypothetical protein
MNPFYAGRSVERSLGARDEGGLLGNLTLPVRELIDGAASDCHDDNGI